MRGAKITIRRLAVRLALVWIAALALGSPAQAETWPTTEFVFENTDPAGSHLSDFDPFFDYDEDQIPVIAVYEAYLSEVAKYYQSRGFKAPPLPMTQGRNGGRAYVVYGFAFEYPDTTAKAAFIDVGKTELRFDIPQAIVNGRPTERSFEDLAHELFHRYCQSKRP